MNYSCLPNEDGSLKGSKTMSTTVGMDIDHLSKEEMPAVRERILQKKEELGLLMLEESARGGGYHLVFRRRPELSQEENLKWASELLEVKYDDGAKDITRVFFTTTGSAEDLLFLDDEIFRLTRLTPSPSLLREGSGQTQGQKLSTPLSHREGMGESLEGKGEGLLSFPSDFKGISYTSIIGEFWRRTGGEPSEGERNKRLHQLAANLRAICDDNEEWLLEVMPRYGLSAQEMRGIIHSACKEPTKGSRLIDKIVKALETGISPDEVDDAEAVQEETGVKVNVKALPIGLKESLTGVPVSMHMPVLCSLMPLAAAYADQVEVRYCDGEMQKLGMMSIIYGEQASGKSVCKHAVNIWKRQLDDEDALARKREDEWKERKKNRKANEKAPDDPKVLIRVVPVTVSCSTLLKRLKNADGHTLFSFGEELDTLRKTNGAGSWSSKYDIYRLAFDPIDSEWGQDYNSDQAESGVVKVAYNWSMLGTSGAVRKCFKADNVENGLSSRILLAEMPDTSFAKMPHYGRRTQEDESKIQEAVTRLRSYSGYVDTPRLRKAIDQWVEEQRVVALKDIDHVKDTYRRRAAVIGFRCGVIFHLLTGRVKESNACVEFATMMADYCLNQQIKVFGAALQNQYVDAQQECQRYGANNSIFDQLPPTFTADDLAALKPANVPRNSIIKIISRWNRDGWVVKADSKRWSKAKSDNDKVTS
ncbi:hypothetical protein [Prevotella communis]|uniref:hypothetical protein n=1 Tax=Prevotella communis TaxID=2913614 RepID=UPI003D685732